MTPAMRRARNRVRAEHETIARRAGLIADKDRSIAIAFLVGVAVSVAFTVWVLS